MNFAAVGEGASRKALQTGAHASQSFSEFMQGTATGAEATSEAEPTNSIASHAPQAGTTKGRESGKRGSEDQARKPMPTGSVARDATLEQGARALPSISFASIVAPPLGGISAPRSGTAEGEPDTGDPGAESVGSFAGSLAELGTRAAGGSGGVRSSDESTLEPISGGVPGADAGIESSSGSSVDPNAQAQRGAVADTSRGPTTPTFQSAFFGTDVAALSKESASVLPSSYVPPKAPTSEPLAEHTTDGKPALTRDHAGEGMSRSAAASRRSPEVSLRGLVTGATGASLPPIASSGAVLEAAGQKDHPFANKTVQPKSSSAGSSLSSGKVTSIVPASSGVPAVNQDTSDGQGTASMGTTGEVSTDPTTSGFKAKGRFEPADSLSSGPVALNGFAGAIAMAANSGGQRSGAANATTPVEAGEPDAQAAALQRGAQSAPALAGQPELPSLTNARLVQRLSGSEMQVSLHSDDLGRLTVHTAFARDAISAQITLDNPQLGSTLAAHLPAMEQRLAQDHGLRASVTIDTQTGNGADHHRQSGEDAQNGRRPIAYAFGTSDPASSSAAAPVLSTLPSSSVTGTAERQRLDIRI